MSIYHIGLDGEIRRCGMPEGSKCQFKQHYSYISDDKLAEMKESTALISTLSLDGISPDSLYYKLLTEYEILDKQMSKDIITRRELYGDDLAIEMAYYQHYPIIERAVILSKQLDFASKMSLADYGELKNAKVIGTETLDEIYTSELLFDNGLTLALSRADGVQRITIDFSQLDLAELNKTDLNNMQVRVEDGGVTLNGQFGPMYDLSRPIRIAKDWEREVQFELRDGNAIVSVVKEISAPALRGMLLRQAVEIKQ